MIIRSNYSLLPHNSFGLDITANSFIEYCSEAELLEVIHDDRLVSPFLHIGAGTNLLFTKDFLGTILHSTIKGVSIIEEDSSSIVVKVGAGESWDDFVICCAENEWYGVENLSLIPGEVGAAAIQNIGAYGVEVKDLLLEVETIDSNGIKKSYSVEECMYSYRNSIFKSPEMKNIFITNIVLKLSKLKTFSLEYGNLLKELPSEVTLANVRETIIRIRESKLPDYKVLGNGGSFFMNPIVSREKFEDLQSNHPDIPYYIVTEDLVKIPAGWLIEKAGWKGRSLGNAGVYEKQALVIVNLGGTTGDEILELADRVNSSISEQFGVFLEKEVLLVK